MGVWESVVAVVMLSAAIGLAIRSRQQIADFRLIFEQEEEPVASARTCFPALFSFGSSVADTGTQSTVWPGHGWTPDRPPYGSTFFGRPSRRYCDGRLHIDFWATALGIRFLDSFLKSVRSNFRQGANFAAAGATACNQTQLSPFYLYLQLNQFREFKRDVLNPNGDGPGSEISPIAPTFDNMPPANYFEEALYVIAIGGNDFLKWFLLDNLTVPEVASQVPKSSAAILAVVEALYDEGARNILVENVHPVGCMPIVLSSIAQRYSDQWDAVGCVKPVNDLVQLHNTLLKQRIIELADRLQDASISVIDTYTKRYDIIVNHRQYGLEVPIKACCGIGGDYNFNNGLLCGASMNVAGQVLTAAACDNISSHVIWDGVHFTEAVNRIVMKSILSGDHFQPPFDLSRNDCKLFDI